MGHMQLAAGNGFAPCHKAGEENTWSDVYTAVNLCLHYVLKSYDNEDTALQNVKKWTLQRMWEFLQHLEMVSWKETEEAMLHTSGERN